MGSAFQLPADIEDSATTTGAARRMSPVFNRSGSLEERLYSSENPDIRVVPVQVTDENDNFAYMLGKRLDKLNTDQGVKRRHSEDLANDNSPSSRSPRHGSRLPKLTV